MEIDCTDEDKLNKLVSLLKLDKKNMHYGSYDKTFTEYYGIPSQKIIDKTPKLTFEQVKGQISPRKNNKLFKEIVELNKKINVSKMDSYYKKYKKQIFHPYFDKTKTQQTRKNKITRHKKTRKKKKSV